jgi:hypothetical protein
VIKLAHILPAVAGIAIGLIVLFFGVMFVIALIQTIKELRSKKPVGFNAGLGFGGDLGVKLIRKGQPIPQ